MKSSPDESPGLGDDDPPFHVDERTSFYYASQAEAVAATYSAGPSPLESLKQYIPENGRALDIGCGSGRDLLWLQKRGLEVQGAEPSAEMAAASVKLHPELSQKLAVTGLPELNGIEGPFDLILCNAVMQHIPDSRLFDSLFGIRRILAPAGRLILSVPLNYPGIDRLTERDAKGRLFRLRPHEEYTFIAERIGFSLVHSHLSDDSLGRAGVKWITLIYRNTVSDGRRPVEQIESIIRSDRKTNTYKFALLRALGEIAVTTPHAAQWRSDGRVALATDYVAEKWLEYYWPLVEHPQFILQGASNPSKADITFRTELTTLVHAWKRFSGGGLGSFRQAWLQGELNTETNKLVTDVLRKIKTGIRQPVQYAGTEEKVFAQEGTDILIEHRLWQEFALMGRWFEDSIIMRWAQFSAELKNQSDGVNTSTLIETLFSGVEQKRDTGFARSVYDSFDDLRCTWSEVPLSGMRGYDVDHVIPFALWHNNNLWNLMPAASKVNMQKSDKLPTRTLLTARAPIIRANWELLYDRYRSRFSVEAQRFMGVSEFKGGRTCFDDLFHTFTEAVEVTALQRSVPRWEPKNIY